MAREVALSIDGCEVRAREGLSILEGTREAGLYIPSLCYHPSLEPGGSCGLCIVQIEGIDGYPKACLTRVEEGMVVWTNTPEISEIRQKTLETVLSRHPYSCLVCPKRGTPECNPIHLIHLQGAKPCLLCRRNGYCELQNLSMYLGIKKISKAGPIRRFLPAVEGFIERNPSLCILCGRCVRVCQGVRGVGAIDFILRDGEVSEVGPINGSLKDSGCRFCGACIEVCPTGALMDEKVGPAKREPLIPCREDCPVGVDVPRLVSLIAQGEFEKAAGVIRRGLPLAGVLARVCNHPCEVNCRRGEINEPVAIRALEKFALEVGGNKWEPERKSPTGNKIAIVGSGPCGLSCGYYLSLMGHQVTIFEALPEPGGMMRTGIPEFRLPRDILRKEIELIKAAGVDIRTTARVESLEGLFLQGYDAIFIATGVHVKMKLGIEGEDLAKVEDALSFLKRAGTDGATLGRRVVVVGGGNIAITASRTALCLKAEEVLVIYSRTDAEMPAHPEEVKQALEEGVRIEFLAHPVRIRNDGERPSLTCIRMKLGKKWDKEKKRIPEPIEGSEFDIPADNVIVAEGEKLEAPESFNLPLGNGGLLEVNPETLMTSRKRVYAGGAVTSGLSSVLEVVSVGKKAAISIDTYLGGEGIIEAVCPEEPDQWLGKKVGFAYQERVRIPLAHPQERVRSLEEAELVLGEEDAVREADRCLRCHLRLHLRRDLFVPQSSNCISS